jgi:hypothetical protein
MASTTPSEIPQYPWQKDYHAALLETDARARVECLSKARQAVVIRRVALRLGTGNDGEIAALDYALRTLRVLQSELAA